MYFVKRIIIDLGSSYKSSQIVAHTNKTIALAKTLLEEAVKDYVREEKGRDAAERLKILDIHDLTQVTEPLVDGILLYRLENDPHKILVYQRKSTIVSSTSMIWGKVDTAVAKFYMTDIFELEEYASLKFNDVGTPNIEQKVPPPKNQDPEVEMINVNPEGPKVTVPVPIGSVSKGNLLNDLKNCNKFKDLKKKANEAVPLSFEQFKEQDVKPESILVLKGDEGETGTKLEYI